MSMTDWNIWLNVEQLLQQGGPVLWVVLVVLMVGWVLVIERYVYLYAVFPAYCTAVVASSQRVPGRLKWANARFREALVAQAGQRLRCGLPALRTIVAACPLLGLLGTVFGMLHVFENMAVLGVGNARVVADGVSQATLSTLAGMVAALSLVYFPFHLEQAARRAQAQLATRLDAAVSVGQH